MSKNQPIHEIRLGAVKATLWSNTTQHGPRINTTFSRIYRQDGQWKETTSFGRDDLPLVQKVADQVHDYIFSQNTTAEIAAEGTA